MDDLLADLRSLNQPLPRYTSYPTAAEWRHVNDVTYEEHLSRIGRGPVSLYFHVPFCETMCLYCGCSVILNRKRENEERYVQALQKEIALIGSKIGWRPINQLHFGGGTPTKLLTEDFEALFSTLSSFFTFQEGAEIAIEVDPRTVFTDGGEKLRGLKRVGFNRISFGVQDTDPEVQEAVRRRQTLEMTAKTFQWAREIDFEEGINVDLIYGLPFQTEERFRKTAEDIVALGPDRIALFSYAKIPWLKAHQKAIKEETLPSTEEKFRLYLAAREIFLEAGYVTLGMDHFAKKGDSLALGLENGTLGRNFQGYTLKPSSTLLGLGVTAIGDLTSGYFQNEKDLPTYYRALEQNRLPTHRGLILTPEDHIRRYVIHTLMCRFQLDKELFFEKFNLHFDTHFAKERVALEQHIQRNLVQESEGYLTLTPRGRLFVRNVVSTFDAYHSASTLPRFSQSV